MKSLGVDEVGAHGLDAEIMEKCVPYISFGKGGRKTRIFPGTKNPELLQALAV